MRYLIACKHSILSSIDDRGLKDESHGYLHFSTFRSYVCEGIEDVGELVCWKILRLVLPSVDSPVGKVSNGTKFAHLLGTLDVC